MSTRYIHIRARIRLLSAEEGGRKGPIANSGTTFSYRPQHNFSGPENKEMVEGFIHLEPGTAVHPGESSEIEMILMPSQEINLSPGREWRIQEGSRVVGIGTILQVLADPWRG